MLKKVAAKLKNFCDKRVENPLNDCYCGLPGNRYICPSCPALKLGPLPPGAEAWALTKKLVMNSILKRTELQRSLKAPELQRSLKWSGNYRARWHDYRARAIYHITLLKAPGCESFGRLGCESAVPPGSPGSPYLIASPTGKMHKGGSAAVA